MKMPRLVAALLASVSLLAKPSQTSADEDVVWTYLEGFDPPVVQIMAYEAVFWTNLDPFTLDTRVTFDGGFSFLLENLTTQGVVFEEPGVYEYWDDGAENLGTVIVLEPPPTGILLEFPRFEGNQFVFDVSGLSFGKTNVVQVSTNLVAWVSVSTNENLSATMSFTNNATLPVSFYRVIELE
jgi:hypothetical protein